MALQYLYEQCSFKGKEPEIPSIDQAKVLASFAHKWNIQAMLEAADVFIQRTLCKEAPLRLLTVMCCLDYRAKPTWDVWRVEQIIEVDDVYMFVVKATLTK